MPDWAANWATTDEPKRAALQAATSIEMLAAQHTWLVAENSTLRKALERIRDGVFSGNQAAELARDALA